MRVVYIELTEEELNVLRDFLGEHSAEGESKALDSVYEKLTEAL